jgi:hypothetical protein
MAKLTIPAPTLLGQAIFQTKVLDGTWLFRYPSSGQEDYMTYVEELDNEDRQPNQKNLLDWLNKNPISSRDEGFVFQGINGARCIIDWPKIERLSVKCSSPPSSGGEYKLPFRTDCKYRVQTAVKWQPNALGIPSEIKEALKSFGYRPKV